MAYWENNSNNPNNSLDYYGSKVSGKGSSDAKFYELEPAVVLDIILDKDHEIFKQGTSKTISNLKWEADLNGEKPKPGDVDYTWIGRALVRLIKTEKNVKKEILTWAYPMEAGFSEYPLVNEMVIVANYFGRYFYSRRVNYANLPNHGVDFGVELSAGGAANRELNSDQPFAGPISKTAADGGPAYTGVAGRYFLINKNVRSLKRHEGDIVVESRFGQSIKIGSYDDNRDNDIGGQADLSGNPMIIIRNRQRPLLKEGEYLKLHNSPNPGGVTGTAEEKNVGGYIKEDINHDGSSIYITSGQTISGWVTTCFKKMFAEGNEEVSAFSPEGCSTFQYPMLDGDQIVINSDRLIFSSRYGETFHYSKRRHAVVTDSEYTVDAHDQIVMTTHVKTVFNSPAIYLGEYNETGEPVLLGQTTINWLYELCQWLLTHTHWYIHSHPDAGSASPEKTQLPVQIERLKKLRDSLHTLASRRVFVTGGGFAPGQDGASI